MMFMKRTKQAEPEIECPSCAGTGFPAVKQPAKPERRIYPAPCKQCFGKGRLGLKVAVGR
jgi:DnaJ-class molecular chaperone